MSFSSALRNLSRRSCRELLEYVAVSLAILSVIAGMFYLGMSFEFFSRRVMVGIFGVVALGQLISSSQLMWKRKAFWIFLGVAFVVHCLVWALIISRFEVWRWNLLTTTPLIIEYAAVLSCREMLAERYRRKWQSKLRKI